MDLPADDQDDDTFEANCRASQQAGRSRRKELEDAYGGKVWIKTCYARHTFEVDFLLADNRDEVIATLPSIFESDAVKERSAEKLRDTDIAIAGREVLRLAKRQGKGWFAVLLAEHVTVQTTVPDYILEAIAFACHSAIDKKTLCQMVAHRCDTVHRACRRVTKVRSTVQTGTGDDVIQEYATQFPDDVLSRFIQILG